MRRELDFEYAGHSEAAALPIDADVNGHELWVEGIAHGRAEDRAASAPPATPITHLRPPSPLPPDTPKLRGNSFCLCLCTLACLSFPAPPWSQNRPPGRTGGPRLSGRNHAARREGGTCR